MDNEAVPSVSQVEGRLYELEGRFDRLLEQVEGGPVEEGAEPPGLEARMAALEDRLERIAAGVLALGERSAATRHPQTLDELPSPFAPG
jgi:hypothetical protein